MKKKVTEERKKFNNDPPLNTLVDFVLGEVSNLNFFKIFLVPIVRF